MQNTSLIVISQKLLGVTIILSNVSLFNRHLDMYTHICGGFACLFFEAAFHYVAWASIELNL